MKDIDRLLKIIGELDLTDSEFAITIGIKPQNLTQFKNGSRNISSRVWVGIIKNFSKFNPYWVITGEGEMYNNSAMRSGSIEKGKLRLTGSTLNEPAADYGRITELEQENSRLKDELLKCKDQLIEVLRGKN